jgi:flagellar biosynthesis/type III secretory pathway protein FliH
MSKEYNKGFSEGYEKGFKDAIKAKERLYKLFEPMRESIEKLNCLNEVN